MGKLIRIVNGLPVMRFVRVCDYACAAFLFLVAWMFVSDVGFGTPAIVVAAVNLWACGALVLRQEA